MSLKAKYFLTLLTGAFFFLLSAPALHAVSLKSFQADDLKKVQADSWDFDGKNIIVKGNVCLPGQDAILHADTAIINTASKDFEAVGNVRFYSWQTEVRTLTPDKLAELAKSGEQTLEILQVSGDVWGSPAIQVKLGKLSQNISAERLTGNFTSGYFSFNKGILRFNNFVCKAEYGERRADGQINVRNAEISPCSYLADNNAHFSISAGNATFTPHKTEFYGPQSINRDPADHSIMLTNGYVRAYGVPVFWLPVFYKPKDEEPGLFGSQYGRNGDWGYYISAYQSFLLNDYPYTRVKLLGDFYSDRGFGYGGKVDINTERSKTHFSAYMIYDTGRFDSDDYHLYNIDIPHYRYNFHLSNVTHITPRLDFRGVFDLNSDPYIVKDFFESRYNPDPRPATFVALEQQSDLFSAYIYARPKLNTFYTEVEHYPSIGIEVPRQEIFDTNIYYQGDVKAGYLNMEWVKFDKSIPGSTPLGDYSAVRVDTTHFLYYPIRLDWLTLVPRAGIKVTGYSKTSTRGVTYQDHIAQRYAANLENRTPRVFANYNDLGGDKFRVAGEVGVEASTKIHRTWNDVKSSLLNIDGLRHIIRPYANYTYIPRPTINRDYLYYFDDIDRLTEQHFVRFGLENSLQTRDGNSMRTFFSMLNYWDLYMQQENGFRRLGDFCTNLQMSPLKNLTVGTNFSIDTAENNGKAPQVIRNGRPAGHPNLNLRWLNNWDVYVTYSPFEDITLKLAYTMSRPYKSRSTYSMGSTLTQYEAGRLFDKYYNDYVQEFSATLTMPITPDRRTWMQYDFVYDLYMGYIDTQALQLLHKFHCFTLVLACSFLRDEDSSDNYDFNYSVSVILNGLTPTTTRNSTLIAANEK